MPGHEKYMTLGMTKVTEELKSGTGVCVEGMFLQGCYTPVRGEMSPHQTDSQAWFLSTGYVSS